MPDCECLATCIFFNDHMARMPKMAGRMKCTYCHGDFMSCARHRVMEAKGREAVPADLFPNMSAVADALLEGPNRS